MSDMRLIVAGAGGRMGRTLVKAITETPGLMLAGATEGEGSPLLGQDSGVLAGLPPNRVLVTSEVRPLTSAADAIIDFTVPAATVRLAALAAETQARRTSSAPPACRPRMTRRSRRPRRRPRS